MIPKPDGVSDNGSCHWDIDDRTTLWWHPGRGGGRWHIYYAASIDAGQQAPVELLQAAHRAQQARDNGGNCG